MLSPESIEHYRQMPLGEKLKLVLQMSQEAEKYLLMDTPEQVDRKFELIRRENDLRNENILKALARLPKCEPPKQSASNREPRKGTRRHKIRTERTAN